MLAELKHRKSQGFLDFTAKFWVSTEEGEIEIEVSSFGATDTKLLDNLSYRAYVSSLSDNSERRSKVVQVQAFAETELDHYDAFDLATDCVERWKHFIETYIEG
jgi:hypothetical protein